MTTTHMSVGRLASRSKLAKKVEAEYAKVKKSVLNLNPKLAKVAFRASATRNEQSGTAAAEGYDKDRFIKSLNAPPGAERHFLNGEI